uniref:Putative secreted protein n=1 Tax=Ixodes ricinus TaxID=34613 RepID=A0A6B0UFV2_IXORI
MGQEIILMALGLSIYTYILTLPLDQVYSTIVYSISEPTESHGIAACIEATHSTHVAVLSLGFCAIQACPPSALPAMLVCFFKCSFGG